MDYLAMKISRTKWVVFCTIIENKSTQASIMQLNDTGRNRQKILKINILFDTSSPTLDISEFEHDYEV